MAELFLGRPIFPGRSESEQLFQIVSVLGTRELESWREGFETAKRAGISYPTGHQNSLNELLIKTGASQEAISLIKSMLTIDPSMRPSADTCL